jgi:putative transposase
MTYPLVADLAAGGVPVAVTCRVLGFSKQAYYAWVAAPVTRRDLEDAYLINPAVDIHLTTRRSDTGSSPTSCPPVA